MFTDRVEIPDLILIEAIGLAFFVIHFHGPAMASNTGDAPRLPLQPIGNEEAGCIRQVRLGVVDGQSLLAKGRDPMVFAVTVVGLLFAFVGNRDFLEERLLSRCERLVMLLLQLLSKGTYRWLSRGEFDWGIAVQGADISPLQDLIQIPAKRRVYQRSKVTGRS